MSLAIKTQNKICMCMLNLANIASLIYKYWHISEQKDSQYCIDNCLFWFSLPHRPPVYQSSYPSYSSYPTTNTYHPGFGAVYGYRSLENSNLEEYVQEDSDEDDRVVIQIPYMADHSRFVV